jgi:hypothetical protein
MYFLANSRRGANVSPREGDSAPAIRLSPMPAAKATTGQQIPMVDDRQAIDYEGPGGAPSPWLTAGIGG